MAGDTKAGGRHIRAHCGSFSHLWSKPSGAFVPGCLKVAVISCSLTRTAVRYHAHSAEHAFTEKPLELVLQVRRAGKTCARFTFDELCGQPLGSTDYSAIADAFKTVVITDVPDFSLQACSLLIQSCKGFAAPVLDVHCQSFEVIALHLLGCMKCI